jgi:aminoglycoside phosphotransferase (APT) family kinase protein
MPDEILQIDETLIRHAIEEVDTALACLPLEPLAHHGTETALYRLGQRLLVRFPRIRSAMAGFAAETRWLPHLAPHLPLAVPTIVSQGHLPTDPPVPWCVQDWIDGVDATAAPDPDLDAMADRLAACLRALRSVPVPPKPPIGARGGALAPQDAAFRAARSAAAARGLEGLGPAIAAWERGLAAEPWTGPPVWLHGDLVPGNLILSEGHLTALIDWAFVTVGDPAYDLIPAWFLFEGTSRARFLEALAPDAATISRARARVAWQCVMALPHYLDTNPAMVRLARGGIARLSDGGP